MRAISLTKTPERSSLLDENFKKLVSLSYNSPPIHEVDFTRYLKLWESGKHHLAVFKTGGGNQRVLERKGGEHKHTVLAKRSRAE
jgi:hypothetical protein